MPVIRYADDITLFVPVYKTDVCDLQRMQKEVGNFNNWCQLKSSNVYFSRTPLFSVPVFENVMHLKIFGLFFIRLDWSDHSASLCNKVYKSHDHDQALNKTIRNIMEFAWPVFFNPGSTSIVPSDC